MKASGIVQHCQIQALEFSLPFLLWYLEIGLNVAKLSKIILREFFFFNLLFLFIQICQVSAFSETLQSIKTSRNTYAHVVCNSLIQSGRFSSECYTDDFLNMSCHKLFAKSITSVSHYNLCGIFHPLWWRQVCFVLFCFLIYIECVISSTNFWWSVFNSQPLKVQSETMEVCDGLMVPKLSSIMLIYIWFIFFLITLVQAACWQNTGAFASCQGSESFYKWDCHVVI